MNSSSTATKTINISSCPVENETESDNWPSDSITSNDHNAVTFSSSFQQPSKFHCIITTRNYNNTTKTNASILAIRVAVAVTLSSLFSLLGSPKVLEEQYPEAVWILRTAGVVASMPSLDSASALKRAYERIAGTIVGAGIGLVVGFASLALTPTNYDLNNPDDYAPQAVFLGISVSLTSFLFAYLAHKNGYGYSYAAILTIITFSVAAYSFFGGSTSTSDTIFDHPWQVPCWRTLNIIIGCLIGSICSLVLWPVSTINLIETQVYEQGMAVSKSAQSVLKNAHDTLIGRRKLPAYDDILRHDSPVAEDEAYTIAIKNMKRWTDCKALFPMLDWDPKFQFGTTEENRMAFQLNMTHRLRRLFCIQTTIMCMDGIARTGLRHDEQSSAMEHKILKDLESTISVLFDSSNSSAERETAAKTLVTSHLNTIRKNINETRERLSQIEFRVYIPSFREDMPLMSLESQELHVLFFLLAESLIIRSTRLYFFCKLPSYGRRSSYKRAIIVDTSKLSNLYQSEGQTNRETIGLLGNGDNRVINEEAFVQTNNAMLEQKKIAEQVQETLQAVNSTDDSIQEASTTSETNNNSNQRRWISSRVLRGYWTPTAYNHDSFVFAVRFAVTVAVCSLFIFCFPSSDQYPYSLWVITSAQIVSWAPAVDTSTAIQKGLERSLGTIIGAVIGLLVGYLSFFLSGTSYMGQAAMLGLSTALTGFGLIFFAQYVGYPSHYVATLGTTTFGYVSLAFYSVDTASAWEAGVFRSANECLGSVIGSLMCIVLWPTSTRTSLTTKVRKLFDSVGKSASTVLQSAHGVLSGLSRPPSFDELLEYEEIKKSEKVGQIDDAYDSYMKCLDAWKSCQALLPMLQYDPFHRCFDPSRTDKEQMGKFRERVEIVLGRCFRIQTVLSMIDIIIRTGIHDARSNDERVQNDAMDIVKEIGGRVAIALDLNQDGEERVKAVEELLQTYLVRVRNHVKSVHESQADSPFRLHIPSMYSGMPDMSLDTREQVALFFQMLELLIIRVVRLHYYCQIHIEFMS